MQIRSPSPNPRGGKPPLCGVSRYPRTTTLYYSGDYIDRSRSFHTPQKTQRSSKNPVDSVTLDNLFFPVTDFSRSRSSLLSRQGRLHKRDFCMILVAWIFSLHISSQ